MGNIERKINVLKTLMIPIKWNKSVTAHVPRRPLPLHPGRLLDSIILLVTRSSLVILSSQLEKGAHEFNEARKVNCDLFTNVNLSAFILKSLRKKKQNFSVLYIYL